MWKQFLFLDLGERADDQENQGGRERRDTPDRRDNRESRACPVRQDLPQIFLRSTPS